MPPRTDHLDSPLMRLDRVLGEMSPSAAMKPAIDRWRTDAAALRFHLAPRDQNKPILLAVIGGTGTGKSTLVNRLLGVDASATSFRRTFTTGAVAIARDPGDLAGGWLGVEQVAVGSDKLPARGQNGSLVVVPRTALPTNLPNEDLLAHAVLIDTPDLDGDQPVHHAEADRVFRWAEAVIFLVTPEKYQMRELLPYYRLASRYGVPAVFVMNKCEEQVVVEDYREQLRAMLKDNRDAASQEGTAVASEEETQSPAPEIPVFTVARDDAAYQAPPGEDLAALRGAIARLGERRAMRGMGVALRAVDLAGRLQDQILGALRAERSEANRIVEALRDMESPVPGIDVNPVTQDLERRLQQRSVLYLMGPQRVLERVRQAPVMLLRLPRVAWDYVMRGQTAGVPVASAKNDTRAVPDFTAVLSEQFSALQSRIDDLLRTSPIAQRWIAAASLGYDQARIAPQTAGKIADEEMSELRAWLENRWNATPRDTKMVHSLLRYLPGGKKLTALAESAPYLLVVVLIAHHALFGTDLLVLGGYTIATWLTERLSNEVAARTRAANARMSDRFTRLAHDQIQKLCAWINQQAVAVRTIDLLAGAALELARASGAKGTE